MLSVPIGAAEKVRSERAASALTLFASLVVYGLFFALLRDWAREWATLGHFSLWFPAAGLRFAFLWWSPQRVVPLAALAEAGGGVALGALNIGMSFLEFLGTVGPCLIYGLVIALLKRTTVSAEDDQLFNPMPFAAAAVVGSALAGVAALAWALPSARVDAPSGPQETFELLLVFSLGDLLGILLLAPPLLALKTFAASRRLPTIPSMPALQWLEISGVLGLTWLVVWGLLQLGYGLHIEPAILGTCWVALRGGRLPAWLAIVASAVIVLPLSSQIGAVERMHMHMVLTCIAAGGYVVGSYADAQLKAYAAIKRRDRMLYQAERLKTLRAMSLGIIHEINTPLATIALEASNLVSLTSSANFDGADVREIAERVNHKATGLSDLVRRLRRFGSTGGEERTLMSANALVHDVLTLAEPEALANRVKLDADEVPPALLQISEVEMRQALLNLLRNAIESSSSGSRLVKITTELRENHLTIAVANHAQDKEKKKHGMRVGLHIARAIAKAHAGNIATSYALDGEFRQTLSLPVVGRSGVA